MIGATTTVELSPTGIDGDGFDVFSSLRDGSEGEDFSSGIDEAVTDGVSQFDLVAVAGGKAELDVAMSDDDTKEDFAPIDPERCRNFGTAACLGCVNLGLCQDRQAAMMEKNNDLQPEEQLSTLEQLLREDEAPGEIVWAQVVPETDEAGNLGQTEEVSETASPEVMGVVLDGENITEDDGSKEQTSNVHDEEDFKAAETTIEVVKDAGVDDYAAKPQATNPVLDELAEMSEQLTPEDTVVLPTPMAVEAEPVAPAVKDVNKVSDDFADMVVSDIQASPQIEVKEPKSAETVKPVDSSLPTSPVEIPSRETPPDNTTVDHAGDYDNSYHMVSKPEEKSAPPATEQEPSVQMPDASVNVPMEDAKHETPAKEVVAVEVSVPVKEQPDQPAVMTLPIQDYVEYGEEPAVDHNSTQPVVVDMPVAHEVVEVVPTENAAIEPEAPTPVIPVETIVDEDELWTDPLQGGGQEVAVDQTVYETPTSPVEQLDDAVMERCSCDSDEEVWAEENVVFFVEQSSVAEPEATLTEAVTTEPLTEATIVASEEIDEPEVFVADEIEIEPVEPLDNIQVISVPEITKDDHEPVERSMVPVSSAIEPASNATLDKAPVQMSEEYGLPREKQDNVITITPEENGLWLGSDEPETMVMDGSDAEQSGDLSEEQEVSIVIDRVAEVTETELSERDDLMTDDVADGYGYDSEVNAADDFLIVKHHPSLGLWTDDSRLNPEDSKTPTTGSASVVSWLTKLVGVVAVHVVYNTNENKLSIQ
ncbi:hypothetical protein [Candidatus Nanosynbacter featherlites]|uniref:Uncharacterized protein n=1 Tax=Candidatus Nanosynbacter featherlites TaxID=2572088 RepID=A0A4P9A404_9BACT|nr:hypothetical protein [Candidatus Nanosynbacter featherlites]QCT42551.1 hypothetical protein FBF37_03790 [Candidatus Nanosynbacter featherlites]